MSPSQRPRRAGLIWVAAGAIVLLGGVAAVIVNMTLAPSESPATGETVPPSASAVTPTATPGGTDSAVVDPAASDRGWVPEPITTDPDLYARAALSAAASFDTTLASRTEWLRYLDTWFTPDTRYESESDREAELAAAKLELRQGVVFPEEMWDSLAQQDGRVAGESSGELLLLPVPEDASGEMRIATGNVDMTFTQTDGTGAESSYTETVRVSVQVLCGAGSVPVPDSPQQAGDCKVVRFFTEPVEE